MIKANVKINTGAITRVKTRLSEKRRGLKRYRISLGIHSEQGAAPALNYQGQPTGLSLIEAALIHEYGAGNVPERSFLRSWFDLNIARMKREMRTAMKLEMAGDIGVVDQLAEHWTHELMEWIKTGSAGLAELSPFTMQQRERAGISPAPPLYATGQLVDAIRAGVETYT